MQNSENNEQGMTKQNGTERLTPAQAQAVSLLAAGRGPTEVAEELGVSRTTLWEWQHRPDFEAAYNRERAEVLEALRDGLRGAQLAAVRVLHEVAKTEGAPLRDRLAAARALLSAASVPEAQPGPTTTEGVEQEHRWAERQRQLRDAAGEMDSLLFPLR